MAEFGAAAASLSLLMLGTLAISGYQEVDRRGLLAARQSAWLEEWTPGGADAALADALHQRLLSDPGVFDPHGRRPLVASDDLTLDVSRSSSSGVSGGTAAAMLLPLRVTGGFFGAQFDLDRRDFVRGEVAARVAPLQEMPPPFDSLDLTLRNRFALLGDAWQAGGAAHVRRRVSGLVPTGLLSDLRSIWRPVAVALSIVEPSLRDLCLGLIEPDRVPENRLSPGTTPAPEGCP